MKKLFSSILLLIFILALFTATALAADKTLTLVQDWRLTSDLNLNVNAGNVLIIDGANKYYVYEMGGILKNTGGGTVYLKNTAVYAAGDAPQANSLAALSKAAKGVSIAAPAKDATVLTLPVIAGYSVTIKSSNSSVISTSGTIEPPSSATNVTLVLTLMDAAGNKADTGNIQVTVPAKTVAGGSSSSSGGGSSTVGQTIPSTGGVTVSVTQSGSNITLSLPDSKITEIIGKSNNKAIFNLSGMSGMTAAVFPRASLNTFAGAGLGAEIGLPQGTVALDTAALRSVFSTAQGTNVSFNVGSVAVSSLNASQQAALEPGGIVFDISILSGTQNITSFEGNITTSVPYSGPLPASVWYLSSNGTLEKLTSSYDEANRTVRFALPGHLSLYVVGQDTSVPAWVNPFTDVSKSDWFYGDVEFAVKKNLFNGTSNTTFSPDIPMSRGMLVTALGRLHSVDISKYSAHSYEDVSAGKYYTPYVEWAKEAGIVNGVGNNKFAPDSNISRQDLAVIIKRYAEYANKLLPVSQQTVTFDDGANISDYAKSAVQTLNSGSIIQGSNNRFDPQGSATRAQVSAILHRFMEKTQ